MFGDIFVFRNRKYKKDNSSVIFFFFLFEKLDVLLVMLEAGSKCCSFYLLYLDLLVHQSHQEDAAAHGLREGVGVGDLQRHSFVHYNPPRELKDKTHSWSFTGLYFPGVRILWSCKWHLADKH